MTKYLVHKTNFSIIEVENPEQIRFDNYSNYEAALLDIRESERENYLSLDTLPTCEKKYWKIVGDQLTEMSEAEKTEIDQAEQTAQAQAQKAQQMQFLVNAENFGQSLSREFMLEFGFTSIEQAKQMREKLNDINIFLREGNLLTALHGLNEVQTDEFLTIEVKEKYIQKIQQYLQ